MPRQLILLTGIPATGKTTVGNYLRDNHAFHHVDFEDGISLKQFTANPELFLNGLNQEKVVISWGFVPEAGQISMVNYILSKDFKLFWFEGDHTVVLKKYIERDKGTNLDAYYYQMFRIISSKVVDQISPKIINTFNDAGEYKELTQIIGEMGIS